MGLPTHVQEPTPRAPKRSCEALKKGFHKRKKGLSSGTPQWEREFIDEEAVQHASGKKHLQPYLPVVKKFIADINEPYARKLEGILTSFGRTPDMARGGLQDGNHSYYTHK